MVISGPGRRLLVGALVGALLAAAVAPGLGGATVSESSAVSGVAGADPVRAQQETPANGTVRHEDPDEVDERGDLEAVEGYLARRLAGRLDEGAVAISQGEYETARSVLGDEYDDELARYVDVAGETAGEDDDESAESFRAAGNESRSFAESVRSFEETYDEYQRANERGDEARARELGRQLLRQSRQIDRTNGRLQRHLRSIENATGRDTSTASGHVGDVTGSVQERAAAVERATFVRTRVEATAAPTDVSFLRPTTVRGRLVDENGTALADRRILIGTGTDAVRVRTNESGEFGASYRPVRLPANATSVSVRYVPGNASGYLGNRTNASVSVTSVTPTVTAAAGSDVVAFGDRVAVSGTVAAEEVPVPGVPVVASVGDVTVGRGATGEDGAYAVSGALPADVPAGDHEVTVRVDQTGRAVRSAAGTAPLSVEPTATTLALNGTVGANGTATVSGRLRTADGTGVGDRTVRLLVHDRPAGTVTTDGDGRFSARIAPADYAAGEDGNVTVVARYDGGGTSLEGSRGAVTLAVPAAEGEASFAGLAPWQWLVVFVLAGLLVTGTIVAWWRRHPDEGAAAVEPAAGREEPADEPMQTPVDASWREDVGSLLEAGETDRAVSRAYGAVRRRLAEEIGAAGALTHWEFYAAAEADGLASERVEALLELTEAYERARFAPAPASAGEAAEAVDRAEAALRSDGPHPGSTTD